MGSERHITRLYYGRTHGWWARIYRTEQGVQRVYSKHFSDGLHGGKGAALRAARAWRDRKLRELRAPYTVPRDAKPPGHGYVRRALRPQKASHTWCYVGWLLIEGRRVKSTSYSIGVHGERGARRFAEAWLERERRALRERERARAQRDKARARRRARRAPRTGAASAPAEARP